MRRHFTKRMLNGNNKPRETKQTGDQNESVIHVRRAVHNFSDLRGDGSVLPPLLRMTPLST